MRKSNILILVNLLILIALSSCSDKVRYDDAIRIKNDKISKYNKIPNEDTERDGKTLRGSIAKLVFEGVPHTCDSNAPKVFKGYVLFLDNSKEDKESNYEIIPIDDIELVADIYNAPKNKYSNLNLFENFNNPAGMREVREIPVDTVVTDTCCPCRCRNWSLSGMFAMDVDVNCPDRKYSWYFLELKPGYAMFSDYKSATQKEGKSQWVGEIAAGIRFGSQKQWGFGLMASTGVNTYNSFTGISINRPVVMFHGRWQSQDIKCFKPVIYADFGMPIDKMSIALPKFDISSGCEDCKKYLKDLKASGNLPEVDFSWPLTFGFGVGVDLPINSWLDLSADLGWRSLAFGEEVAAAGFQNVPSQRRIDVFLFRFGVTF